MQSIALFLAQVSQPASQPASANFAPMPWWFQFIILPAVLLIAGALLGAWIKFRFDRRLPSQQVKRGALKCSATYCRDLLSPAVNDVKDDLEIR